MHMADTELTHKQLRTQLMRKKSTAAYNSWSAYSQKKNNKKQTQSKVCIYGSQNKKKLTCIYINASNSTSFKL